MGHGGSPLPLVHTPSPSLEIASIAEALSSLRLHYEETVVRLYSCQSDVSDMLRDPASSAADAWDVVHTGLTDARIAMEACDKEQWRKAEDLVGALSTMRPKSSSTLSCVASCTRHPPGTCLSFSTCFLHFSLGVLVTFIYAREVASGC